MTSPPTSPTPPTTTRSASKSAVLKKRSIRYSTLEAVISTKPDHTNTPRAAREKPSRRASSTSSAITATRAMFAPTVTMPISAEKCRL